MNKGTLVDFQTFVKLKLFPSLTSLHYQPDN